MSSAIGAGGAGEEWNETNVSTKESLDAEEEAEWKEDGTPDRVEGNERAGRDK